MINSIMKATVLAVLLIAVAAIAFSATAQAVPTVKDHPMEVDEPICSNCHNNKAGMDHLPDWVEVHRYSASRSADICSVCHKESFCADCHALKEEVKPSDKHKQSPGRFMPHRGDYLTQHKIDGRINPARCFRCHGRQNNTECRACHK